jgi:V/A-type H+-transporting ATPase subunit E
MNDVAKVDDLKAALLTRAKSLADEYLERARRGREHILEEANERLRLNEERETLNAKALADRVYRRRVQSSELRLQADLDQLRWSLVESVMTGVRERLIQLVEDNKTYLPMLQGFLAQAAQAIERDKLTAQVNARDLKRLRARWDEFAKQVAPTKEITLNKGGDWIGGIVVQSQDTTISVDNTFEGRITRLQDELNNLVSERLFASASQLGGPV